MWPVGGAKIFAIRREMHLQCEDRDCAQGGTLSSPFRGWVPREQPELSTRTGCKIGQNDLVREKVPKAAVGEVLNLSVQ